MRNSQEFEAVVRNISDEITSQQNQNDTVASSTYVNNICNVESEIRVVENFNSQLKNIFSEVDDKNMQSLQNSSDGKFGNFDLHVPVASENIPGGEQTNNEGDTSQISQQDQKVISIKDKGYFSVVTKYVQGKSFVYKKDYYKCNICDFSCQGSDVLACHLKTHPRTDKVNDDLGDECEDENGKVEVKCEATLQQLEFDETDLQEMETDDEENDLELNEGSPDFKAEDDSPSLKQRSEKRIRKIEKQDMIGHYVCNKCKKTFCRLRYLRKHMVTHKTEQNFLCDECGKHFKTRAYLVSHRKTHDKKSFKCIQCDFTSDNAFAIHAHRQIHTEGSIICDVCGFAYSDKSTLVKHKNVHDMSRPFACSLPGCTWRFKSEAACNAHIRGHSNIEGKFKCSHCGYGFRHKHHLKRHEAKMHGVTLHKTTNTDYDIDDISKTNIQEMMVGETVNILVDNSMHTDSDQLQVALQSGKLVITTDSDGNTINYHVSDIEISDSCQNMLDSVKVGETQTVLVKQMVETGDGNFIPVDHSEHNIASECPTDDTMEKEIHITENLPQNIVEIEPNVSRQFQHGIEDGKDLGGDLAICDNIGSETV